MSSDLYQRRPEKSKVPESDRPYIGLTIDLLKIQGEGDFPCPNCGITISPGDETENIYRIEEERTEEGYVVIHCNKCDSSIRLKGFQLIPSLYPDEQSG